MHDLNVVNSFCLHKYQEMHPNDSSDPEPIFIVNDWESDV